MGEDTGAIDLRVMVFNIEEGGVGVDLAKVVEAIRIAAPDIVALEEAAGNAARIAGALGWAHASARTQVISRYPILEPPGPGACFVYVEVEPDRVVAIASVHPPAEPYGPSLAADGATVEAIVALERRIRLPRFERHLVGATGADRQGSTGVPAGGLQRAVASRLDGGDRGPAAPCLHADPMAGERGDRGGRVPRHLARDPSGSGRRSRADLVGRETTDRWLRTRARHTQRPHRRDLRRGSVRHHGLPDRRRDRPVGRVTRGRSLAVRPPGRRGVVPGRAGAEAGRGRPARGLAPPPGSMSRAPARPSISRRHGRPTPWGNRSTSPGPADRAIAGTGSPYSRRPRTTCARRTCSGCTRARARRAACAWDPRPPSSTSRRSGVDGHSRPGEYVVAYLLDDAPVAVARTPIRVIP